MLRGAEAVGSENRNSVLRDDDGVIWLGGDQGLYRYDPDAPAPPRPPFDAFCSEAEAHVDSFDFEGLARLARGGSGLERGPGAKWR